MRQRLKSVLALLDNDSIEQLIYRFLEVNHRRQRFSALMVSMFNASEGRLDCYRQPDENQCISLKLDADIEDINHPLVQVLRNGVPEIWDNLCQGVRIENNDFRGFIQALPNECGLYAMPLFDVQGRACGVIAVFSENIERFADTRGIFGIYCHIFQHRLNKLQEMAHLRSQLSQIRTVFKAQRQREKQLDELLVSLSTADANTVPGLSQDYSKIDNLTEAVEALECAVLMQRQRQYGNDKNRIAASLGIAPRTLGYKLAKYRCQI
ncbi:helix-turn-helix domain-containing protein [Yersinia pekkanenii]|uniref:Fis family transcriptional regulator n=1 Tax=Yersinia pekkanenii TaxID=1288385 RepID=A0A0T9PNC4_9GAMM|nr:helix-turn-helix domain-containing protein [Yersinia pekkanenii]CNH73937.1 Fis family transcriptional regulator [Yersinia pekkanenii]CRY68029.1 Fis family transcriptional regulator [Yersinia pekkanenii]